ncbi:esterase-like activity of phytase family protein [Marimonas lutisalis]|uniref:esterase-like activity of phytase family protein n=1 Tax=Marimonas lutisalis TaxID=2545756 RepID=UPI0010F64EB6|nr:esterase-like activity of phytase family protein [Marimonas lutisalis]
MRWRPAIALGAAILAGLTLTGSAEEPRPGQFLGRFTWTLDHVQFGGFSGLDFSDDGATFQAITDRGHLATGRIRRDGGTIRGVDLIAFRPLETSAPDSKFENDSEGLALSGDRIIVSFEQSHTVHAISREGKKTTLPRHPDFGRFPSNGGIEALAIDTSGRLHALPERFHYSGAAPVYRLERGQWRVIHKLTRSGGFVPVGADFGPDGALYVLERAFTGLAFASRVRRVVETGNGWHDTTVLQTPPGRHDNLEGLAVSHDEQGRIRLTMISDDNFRFFQRTEIVEYAVEQPGQE